jgi:hypothetical protein
VFDARPGARAAVVALVVALSAVLVLHAMQPSPPSSVARSGTTGRAHRALPIPGVPLPTGGDRLAVYRGLGTWIDIYDVAWRDPVAAVERMAREGVRTLYLQTSNFSRPGPFVYRAGVGRFLDAAHAAGLRVVAWYLPGFDDLARDLRRSIAAVRFRSPHGQAFDSYAVDIESSAVGRPGVRTRRLLSFSARLRAAVGPDYPLGAIIPSPRNMDRRPSFWPGFPYRALVLRYDVLLPMTYFTYQVSGQRAARAYTARNIGIIREETDDPTVPIHVIGGIGATMPETRGFVDAVSERNVIGASYYTFPVTPSRDWRPLRRVRALGEAQSPTG